MASEDPKILQGDPPSSSSSADTWKERILIPTLLAGIVGGGAGLVSKHRKVHGLAKISTTYATNLAIVTGCYCGFGTGALLGRLQGGQRGAIRYSIIFAIAGTAADFATIRLNSILGSYSESISGNNRSLQKKDDWLKWPEWFPIQVLDEEALAAKQAREQQLYAQRALGELNKEES